MTRAQQRRLGRLLRVTLSPPNPVIVMLGAIAYEIMRNAVIDKRNAAKPLPLAVAGDDSAELELN